MLADLPANLTPGWQCIDMAIRCLRTALRSVDMQKAPHVVAALQSQLNVLTKLLSAYTAGTSSGSADTSMPGRAEGSPPSSDGGSDADSQPSASSSDEGEQ